MEIFKIWIAVNEIHAQVKDQTSGPQKIFIKDDFNSDFKNGNKNGVDTLNGQPYPLSYLTAVICKNYLGSHIKISDLIISDMLSLGFLEKVYQKKFLEYLSKVLIDSSLYFGLDKNKAAQP